MNLDTLIQLNAKTDPLIELAGGYVKTKRETGHEARIRREDEPWLARMSAKADRLVEFRSDYYDDEQDTSSLGRYAIGAGALGAAGAGYLYRDKIKAAAGNAGARSGVFARKIGSAYQQGAKEAVLKGSGIMGEIGRGLKYAGRAARKVRFSSRHETLVRLNARIDSLITFEKEPDEDDMDGGSKCKSKPFKKGKLKKKIAR